MKTLTGNEIRSLFLKFFQEKGHAVEPSASLVPHEDPSLLWINSGVATLKKYFDGRVIPQNPRITNAQKSIRTNDIEEVGKTARHHTFFEMLGNFSIGEYFKEEAIDWAWEFLTDDKWIGFDSEKLSVTVHPEDEEAYRLWREKIGVPKERIIRLEGNFWDIGEGPSGPNTEIFYDRGPSYGDDLEDPELYPGGENERYLEIWNLVFSEFNHNSDDTYTPLPKKNIDTGMGLERITSVVQNTKTNFETDLFLPIIEATERVSNRKYGITKEDDTAFKVIADHVRTVTFAVGDGALPSNEGRGYVLRRLLRRAIRYGKQLGVDKPFLAQLVPVVVEKMQEFYPEVAKGQPLIEKVISTEEERFHETLQEGLQLLGEVVERQKQAGETVIPGSDVFRLYDTYGFPVELTEEYAEDEGMTVDQVGFQQEMEQQRARARAARQETDSMQVQSELLSNLTMESTFYGYEYLETNSEVLTIIRNGMIVESADEGDEIQLILDITPFYAESGGQIADEGIIESPSATLFVKDVQKAPNGQHLHTAKVTAGTIEQGAKCTAKVDKKARGGVIRNHTATHLLHQALKDVLGDHVNQAGSRVEETRLRFDFSHFGQVTDEELKKIESIVNDQVWQATSVMTLQKQIEEAKQMGAMALFGEKYGDVVRVVQVGDYSVELCGGCHVPNTSMIGMFRILSEGGIGAGTRRIEAVTGKAAYDVMTDQIGQLHLIAELVKARPEEVVKKVEATLQQLKTVEREKESLAAKLSNVEAGELTNQLITIEGIQVLASEVNVNDANQLRSMMDGLKEKLSSGIILLAAANDGKVQLIAGVTKDLVDKGYHAGKLVKEAATVCGGGGGGRPDMAQAGGKDPAKIQEALQVVEHYVKSV
ncbi:alanine--tRNA ligase [Bacillus fonticola]|uniref:alanine--tRNA ligase n=1 Tax=Bacillus fonticola TaxID=2728853 RepID=UPI00147370C6|nr:alanine--tRNA ligase [Bacillus fonticola]